MQFFGAPTVTKLIDGTTDVADKAFVPKSYILDVYQSILVGYKTPGLWLWGSNNNGQLASDTGASSPIQPITAGSDWKQVSAGETTTAAIKTDGTLWLWGDGGFGQLGNNEYSNKSSPVQTITGGSNWYQVSIGDKHSAAIKTDGTLWLWGYNGAGEIGDNTTNWYSSPVQTVAGGTNWKQVVCGRAFNASDQFTAAIKTDGTLWLWGYGGIGNLGNNSSSIVSSPIQTIAGGSDWRQVAVGGRHTAAIKTDGTLWLWGDNSYGQLGDNTSPYGYSSPIQTITGGTNWRSVACGYMHTAAIKTDGTLWLWGNGGYGQLGNNDTSYISSPIQTITGGTNWYQVSCGYTHTAAIKTDGSLWLWGSNGYWELGDGTYNPRSSPAQTITGGTYWKQVVCGRNFSAAIADGNY